MLNQIPASDEDSLSVPELLKENRVEIMLGLIVAHLLGWTSQASEYVGGMC